MSLAALRRAGPDPDLAHLPVSLDLGAVSVAEGVRAALSVAVLVALNEWSGIPALGEAALGALLTCLCDPGGPLRRRTPALVAFLVLGPLATAGFSLVRNAGVGPAAVAGSFWIACAMFARAWGPVAMQVGNLLTVVAVLSLDRAADLSEAAVLSEMFAAGSAWSVLLTLVIWRIYPFRPVRRAIADVFRRLGVLAADLSALLEEGRAGSDWAAHARGHRRYVRDGIEGARTLLLDTIRGRGQGGPRGNALLIQIEAADQLFGAIIALSDLLEHGDPAARAAARKLLPALRLLLAAIADAVLADRSWDDGKRPIFERLLAEVERAGEEPTLSGIVAAILQRLRIAALMTTPEGQAVNGAAPDDRVPTLSRWLEPLRANLHWQSAALRHAARAGCVALPALLLTLPTDLVYAHWLTITLVLTLQPFFALTWQRAVERVGGTVAGGVVAAALLAVVQTPVQMAALLFPLAIVAFTVRRVSFGLFMAALTPLVVVLSELGRPGTSEFSIALARAGYTVAGGLMAVLGGLLLWPSWEVPRLRTELQNALRAHAAYADAELATLLGEATAEAVEPVRRAAGLASNNLETSLSRAMQEPKAASRADLRVVMPADAALRRIAGRLAALQFEPGLAGAVDLLAWRRWLAGAFAALLDGRALPPGPPADEPGGSLSRIARQVALIDGTLRPEGGAPPAAPSPPPPP